MGNSISELKPIIQLSNDEKSQSVIRKEKILQLIPNKNMLVIKKSQRDEVFGFGPPLFQQCNYHIQNPKVIEIFYDSQCTVVQPGILIIYTCYQTIQLKQL